MAAILDDARQQQARRYARLRRRLWLTSTLLGAVYVLAWLIFGWGNALASWLRTLTVNEWLLVPLFAAVFAGGYGLLGLPFSYYAGFVLPHRFGLSNETLKGWLVDRLKFLLLGGALGLVIVELIYWALRATGEYWWLWTAGGMVVFTVLLVNLAPVLIMPLFNKFVPLGAERVDLAERLLALARRAGTRVRGVYQYDMSRQTKAANAALTGIGNTRRIVVGDTLLNEFTADEVETVLAHELGHHVNRDIPLMILTSSLLTLGGLYLASLILKWAAGPFGFAGPADVAGMPALWLVMGAFELLTQPLAHAISRWRERLADRYALEMTGKKEAFASAFVRLANQNLGEVDPETWVVFMFYDHPPLRERIRMADTWQKL